MGLFQTKSNFGLLFGGSSLGVPVSPSRRIIDRVAESLREQEKERCPTLIPHPSF